MTRWIRWLSLLLVAVAVVAAPDLLQAQHVTNGEWCGADGCMSLSGGGSNSATEVIWFGMLFIYAMMALCL